MMEDDGILHFYRRLKEILAGKPYRILYLDLEDAAAAQAKRNSSALGFPVTLMHTKCSEVAFWRVRNSQS